MYPQKITYPLPLCKNFSQVHQTLGIWIPMTRWWRWPWWRMALIILLVLLVSMMIEPVISDPQTNLLNEGCSQYNSTDMSDFFSYRNTTFANLRRKLSDKNNTTHFATAQESGIYAMAQCRNYLSYADCLACFDAAVSLTQSCSADGGARVIYEGCFLR